MESSVLTKKTVLTLLLGMEWEVEEGWSAVTEGVVSKNYTEDNFLWSIGKKINISTELQNEPEKAIQIKFALL